MINVLFLCTGNSARSILAEALLNRVGAGRFRGFSAGSQPKNDPNPHALALLDKLGHATASLRSKSWDEFAAEDAPEIDIVITVCDSAAGESCPIWPGKPVKAHWGIADPADVTEPTAARIAFLEAFALLGERIGSMVNLPIETMPPAEVNTRLAEIGRLSGATLMARGDAR